MCCELSDEVMILNGWFYWGGDNIMTYIFILLICQCTLIRGNPVLLYITI